MKPEQINNLKNEICHICSMLAFKGLVSGKDGNVSIRVEDDEMLITPSGVCKAFLKPEMILHQRFDGSVIEGSLRSTKEAGMHSRLYELQPDTKAIIHTHPAAATAYAVCGMTFPQNVLLEVPTLLGTIAVADYAPAGSKELIKEVEKCADSKIILLQNHGVIVCGGSLEDAFAKMDATDNTAKTLLYAKLLGQAKEF